MIVRSTILLAVALGIFGIDQASKYWIRDTLALGQSWPADWPIRLTFLTNTGAAFGLFQDQGVFLIAVALVVIGVILFYHRFLGQDTWLVRVSLGLQLGGALGNLVDRLRDGFVTDLIDLQVWPVFNLADSAISVGVAILAWHLLFRSSTKPRNTPAAEPPARLETEVRRER